MNKRALITGISGQDGRYLAEILLREGYRVFGLVRSRRIAASETLRDLADRIELLEGDLDDYSSLRGALALSDPDRVFNLGAQSVVPHSWVEPLKTIEVTGMGPVRLLEAIRVDCPKTRFFQPSSSEMFGKRNNLADPTDAEFYPLSPYGAAKLLGYHLTRLYRERYGIYAVSAVLFNHESPYRPEVFVSRKITVSAAKAKLGRLEKLPMGNINVIRDWGFSGDYMEAVSRLVELDNPTDCVIATGLSHTVKDMLELAFAHVGLDYREYVVHDSTLVRPMDPERIVGDPTKTKKLLNWEPKVSFENLIRMMVDADLERLESGG